MLSQRVKSLKPSPTLALAAKAKELKAEGKDIISLSVGEPDWDTFDSIKKAGVLAINNGDTKYTPASGLPEIRKAIAEQTNSDFGLDYDITEVTVSAGGKFVIFSLLQAVIDPGDEVIIPAPYWVSYPTQVELAGGVPVIAICDEKMGFKLTPDLLESLITKKTKMLILNSPSNPTGFMYSQEELDKLAEVLKKHPDILVMSDDIYNRLVFNESGVAPHILKNSKDLKSRVVIVNGVSKTYSMTGWRLGWALGPAEVIGGMNKYQSQSVSCAANFTQKATLQAITQGGEELKASLVKLKKRRDFAVSEISKLENIKLASPDGAFYVWPDISHYLGKKWEDKSIETSKDFAEALLLSKGVAAVPGAEFGLEGYLRISYALEEDRMSEAIERISSFIKELS